MRLRESQLQPQLLWHGTTPSWQLPKSCNFHERLSDFDAVHRSRHCLLPSLLPFSFWAPIRYSKGRKLSPGLAACGRRKCVSRAMAYSPYRPGSLFNWQFVCCQLFARRSAAVAADNNARLSFCYPASPKKEKNHQHSWLFLSPPVSMHFPDASLIYKYICLTMDRQITVVTFYFAIDLKSDFLKDIK